LQVICAEIGDKHLEPVVTIALGTAEDNTILPGTVEPPAHYGSLDRTLEEMNAKMGNMEDLIGKLRQSLHDREPPAIHTAHRVKMAGKPRRVPNIGPKNRAKFLLVTQRNPRMKP